MWQYIDRRPVPHHDQQTVPQQFVDPFDPARHEIVPLTVIKAAPPLLTVRAAKRGPQDRLPALEPFQATPPVPSAQLLTRPALAAYTPFVTHGDRSPPGHRRT
ncbi:hypothetical protein ACIQB5_41970 [Streptomyces sp. NPDC088560]|uniref:hypothetical protein n=1 Tax=Streptomyces sp. NPDC088560 TaxID=3365868 RepID=UPI0038232B88